MRRGRVVGTPPYLPSLRLGRYLPPLRGGPFLLAYAEVRSSGKLGDHSFWRGEESMNEPR